MSFFSYLKQPNVAPEPAAKGDAPPAMPLPSPVSDESPTVVLPPVSVAREDIDAGCGRAPWDPLRKYVQEAIVYPLLSREEETALSRKVREGDPEARERMIVSNLRFVIKIAKEYEGYGLPILDVIELGNVGLMKAVDRFDPEKGAKFSTYAVWWIKQSILRGLSDQSRTIRLPTHKIQEIGRMKRSKVELEVSLGREATDKEIAKELTIPLERVRDLFSLSTASVHLDAPLSANTTDTVSSRLADDGAESPSVAAEHSDLRRRVMMDLEKLPLRDQDILIRRFGLEGKEPETLETIGAYYGVTRERIRQIEAKALARLKRFAER